MRDLWRKTSYLFWQYPLLWLPVVISDLTHFCVDLALTSLDGLIRQYLSYHSVLTGTTEASVVPLALLAALSGINRLVGSLVGLWLYALAMIAVFTLLALLLAGSRPAWHGILTIVGSYKFRALLLSLNVLGITAAGMIVVVALMSNHHLLDFIASHAGLVAIQDVSYVLTVLLFAAVAWLFAPAAVKMLRASDLAVQPEANRHARLVAALAVLASAAFGILIRKAPGTLLPASAPRIATEGVAVALSLLDALPYIPLFISLALLARSDEPSPAIEEAVPEEPAQP